MRAAARSRTMARMTHAPNQEVAARHARVVVLVEDDAGLRNALDRLLRASGFDAWTFATAEDALSACGRGLARCLVVDLNLPAMSGLDMIDRLQAQGIRTPVIAISAQDEEHVRTAALRRGAVRFLAKPFLGSTLIRAVDHACGAA